MRVGEFYDEVVLPALILRLDQAFPEFGWRRDRLGWVATNGELTRARFGARPDRVVAHGEAPAGFLVHGADPVTWTAYVNGGAVPRGRDFVRAVEEIAGRAGVDATPVAGVGRPDRRTDLLHDFFLLCRWELASERGAVARRYLQQRGLPAESLEGAGLGVVPNPGFTRRALRSGRYTTEEIERSGMLADRRWEGRLCGAWRRENGRIGTLWARSLQPGHDQGAKYLYLRGHERSSLPPHGLSTVLAGAPDRKRDLLVVEGLLDVHHLQARGLENVVALGGTGLRTETLERLHQLGVEQLTLCLDNDVPGLAATAAAIDGSARAAASPTVLVVDPARLDPAKDPDELVRCHGPEALAALLEERECAVGWRARSLVAPVGPAATVVARRAAFARASGWLATLPARLALEQSDALRDVAALCGYDADAAARAFRARHWRGNVRDAAGIGR